VLPYSQDLDAEKIHVRAPTSVIFLCGGPISSIAEPVPSSLRDAFLKILENPVLKGRDLIQAEDITSQISFFNKYENILDFETDLAQIVELIILFCESEGSLAELGAFAMINEIALRLFLVVREKHWNELSFVRLGPLRRIEKAHGRDCIFVVDDVSVGMRGNAFASGNNNRVIGVLFSFDPAERAKLDEAEGVGSGYEHAIVTVINEKGRRRKVLTYLATPDYIDDSLKPYGWYKDFVLAGAREHGLPPEYIKEYIQSVEAIEDPNKVRDKKQRATLGSPGL
jgi:hypothetical protein